ncbi:C39 family peptidase [Bacillus sp. S3]|uniref:C39 family peptidase n=2 Tax=Bacillaceae TaxID=186817 RepID=UPI001CC211D6|nr:C39 family peptidase [Bacillus sp. S3]
MKRIFIFASILLMIGCSHFQANTNKRSAPVKAPVQTKSQAPSPNGKNNKSYTTKDLNNQLMIPERIENIENTVKPTPIKESIMLDVIQINQNPELRYGCEVTSLTMVLQYAGVKTTKMDLYQAIQKDPDPLIKSAAGDILHWGNPADGFVGDMTGKQAGYAVFDQPMINLINQKLPGRAVNLTNQPFEKVLEHVSAGYPVVVWTTGDYRLPDRWEGWYHGKQYIKTPLDLHAVVLVGYDANFVYLNDPLSGKKQAKVGKERFISSWKALQSRAVSYR